MATGLENRVDVLERDFHDFSKRTDSRLGEMHAVLIRLDAQRGPSFEDQRRMEGERIRLGATLATLAISLVGAVVAAVTYISSASLEPRLVKMEAAVATKIGHDEKITDLTVRLARIDERFSLMSWPARVSESE